MPAAASAVYVLTWPTLGRGPSSGFASRKPGHPRRARSRVCAASTNRTTVKALARAVCDAVQERRAGSAATPSVLHDTRAASGPTPLGATGCDRIARSPTATERYCRRAPEANVNAASSFAARCAVAWGGKAVSEPTASSAIATCLIRDVASAQGWCHAPTGVPEYGPSHYATIRAHRGSISVAPLSHFRHEAPGRLMRALTRALWGILPFGERPRRRHNATGCGGLHCCHLAFS